MTAIFLVARDSVRALLHQRLLVAFFITAVALTAIFSLTLSGLRRFMTVNFEAQSEVQSDVQSEGRDTQSIATEPRDLRESLEATEMGLQAMFYSVVSFGGNLVALLIFCSAVSSEIRRGTVRLTLSKPVSRTQFLLGKYLGGVLVMTGYSALTAASLWWFARSQQAGMSPALVWAPWLALCKHLMLGSLAMSLSLMVHPTIAGVLAYFAGANLFEAVAPLYALLPSYDRFNVVGEIWMGTLLDLKDVGLLSLYAMDFVALMILLALWRFRSKELI